MRRIYFSILIIGLMLFFGGCSNKMEHANIPLLEQPKDNLPAWFYDQYTNCAVGTAKATGKSTISQPSNEQMYYAIKSARERLQTTKLKLEPGTRTNVQEWLYKDNSLYVLLCVGKPSLIKKSD